MTVEELIKELQDYPEECTVLVQLLSDGQVHHLGTDGASLIEFRGDHPSIVVIMVEELGE